MGVLIKHADLNQARARTLSPVGAHKLCFRRRTRRPKHLGKCSEHVTPAENDGPYCTASWCSYCCEDDGCNTCKYQCKKGEPAFGELTPSEERKKNGATNNQLPNWRDMPMSEEEEELEQDAAEPVEAKHLGKCSEHVTPAENDGPYCTASWCSYCCEDDGCNTCKYQCKKGEPAFGELTPSEERKKNGATNNQLPNWRDMPMSEEEGELEQDAA